MYLSRNVAQEGCVKFFTKEVQKPAAEHFLRRVPNPFGDGTFMPLLRYRAATRGNRGNVSRAILSVYAIWPRGGFVVLPQVRT